LGGSKFDGKKRRHHRGREGELGWQDKSSGSYVEKETRGGGENQEKKKERDPFMERGGVLFGGNDSEERWDNKKKMDKERGLWS